MGGIIKTDTGYKVESASRKGTFYDVDIHKPSCTCPAFRFQALRKGGICKHVQTVQQHVAGQNADKYTLVIDHLKEQHDVDSIALVERFGESIVNEMLQQGQLIEERGRIRLLI